MPVDQPTSQPADRPTIHTPVMVNEVLEYLRPERGGTFVDVTVGTGGHLLAVARKLQISNIKYQMIGIDQDAEALEVAAERLEALPALPVRQAGGRQDLQHEVRLLQGNFRFLDQLLDQAGVEQVAGVLIDLGLSSFQLEAADRGFSFQRSGRLDMRFGGGGLPAGRQGMTAEEMVNRWSEEKLAALFWTYGEERESRKIARAVVEARSVQPITTTSDLADIVAHAKSPGASRRLHPATKIFQALRIAVNDELSALEAVLPQAARRLMAGGRLVVIAYHSLEDRMVKQFLRQESARLLILTKHVVRPSREEVKLNPRSRSGKLRAAEKLGEGS